MSAITERKYVDLAFQGTSFANQATGSISNGAFMNYSATATFNPLRTINPATSTTADVARCLATLLHDLNAKKEV
jgi:hypothetical protein